MSLTAPAHENQHTTTLGFWLYLMTDCLLFASLFATYAVLHGRTAGGPSSYEIFELAPILVSTILLLTSSLTSGLALLAVRAQNKRHALRWLAVTLVLGLGFIGLEITEFATLVHDGHSWAHSAFLSAFFTLVGTHGLHIIVGLVWGSVLLWVIARRFRTTPHLIKKMTLFTLFWHFLDVIWICIFTFVYLMGSIYS
ncbi:MAG: cytochrome o ubiquinol oxidase subunit III [Candidatus Saccharimonadales bacterium]